MIFAADDGPADRALGRVVLERDACILQTTYAAAFPIESVFSEAWLQSQLFINAITAALSVRRSSVFRARSPSACSSMS
jgi:hypothetical protein